MRLVFKLLEAIVWLALRLTMLTAQLAVGLIFGVVNIITGLVRSRRPRPPVFTDTRPPPAQATPPRVPTRRANQWLD